MKQKTRKELIEIVTDPWKHFVKPFLMKSPMSSNVIAGHADVSASAVRSLRNGTNNAPNHKQLVALTKFTITQTGLK